MNTAKYLVKPNSKIKLADFNPNDTSEFPGDKNEAKEKLTEYIEQLAKYQEVLYAEDKHKLLIVLQAMDTGGKDGVIRNIFQGVNPQGVRVVSFKTPSKEELSRDYLWRIHKEVPPKGSITIFNRSHYEDVLVVRVHNLVDKDIWSKRYRHITEFERMLADEGTHILKFYLNIDIDEQKERLKARLDDSSKHWKFNVGDLEERKKWPDYMEAYEEMLEQTSKEYAPWYVVPSNKKWYRNIVIAKAIIEKLSTLGMKYPVESYDPAKIIIP